MSVKNKKIAIFGGSFDPIHKAHVQLIKDLVNRFDQVIVVPGYETPFKIGVKQASSEDRLAMIKMETQGIKNLIISDIEIKRQGISYSINTAEAFCDYGQLYWVIGSEMLNKLNEWKNIEQLAKILVFYVVPRPAFEVIIPDKIKNLSVKTEIADFVGGEASSSKIKIDIAFDKKPDALSDQVFNYISSHGLYNDYKFIVNRYSEFHLSESRKKHIYNVAVTAVELAKRYDVNVDKTIISALLHDIAKNLEDDDCKRLGIFTSEQIPECRHAELGAQIAEKYFGIDDADILNAIKYHTVCNKEMNKLAKIIALADYIEPDRKFSGLEGIRQLAKEDLNRAIIKMLENTLDYLKGKQIHNDSLEALRYFKGVKK